MGSRSRLLPAAENRRFHMNMSLLSLGDFQASVHNGMCWAFCLISVLSRSVATPENQGW
jgi:hypothetical protein